MKNDKKEKINFKIRKMRKSDLKFLYKIGKTQWPDEDWLRMDFLKNSFNQKGPQYVATVDNKVVGGAILVYESVVQNWITYFIVDKNFRRKGIGSKLLRAITKHLKKGASIFVDTGVADKIAIKFYEKNGFKNRGKVSSFYGNRPAYIFEKMIK